LYPSPILNPYRNRLTYSALLQHIQKNELKIFCRDNRANKVCRYYLMDSEYIHWSEANSATIHVSLANVVFASPYLGDAISLVQHRRSEERRVGNESSPRPGALH